MRKAISLCCLLLAGCQSAVRQYDGVIGYQVIEDQPASVRLQYTDEDRHSWEVVEGHVRETCASLLKRDKEAVSLQILDRQTLTQTVNLSVPIIVGSSDTGSTRESAGRVSVQSPNTLQQGVLRELPLKRLEAVCSI